LPALDTGAAQAALACVVGQHRRSIAKPFHAASRKRRFTVWAQPPEAARVMTDQTGRRHPTPGLPAVCHPGKQLFKGAARRSMRRLWRIAAAAQPATG
jgi:hypothetical protein